MGRGRTGLVLAVAALLVVTVFWPEPDREAVRAPEQPAFEPS